MPAFFQSLKTRVSANATVKTYRQYWSLYGGWKALFASPYLYAAAAVTALLWPIWTDIGKSTEDWTGTAVDIIPSLLGFSMGGMAIMLAFSNQVIFNAITQGGNRRSFFLKIVANFFHFILVQTLALILVLTAHAYQSVPVSAFAFFLFSYGTLVALATAGQLLWTASIFNATGTKNPRSDKDGVQD